MSNGNLLSSLVNGLTGYLQEAQDGINSNFEQTQKERRLAGLMGGGPTPEEEMAVLQQGGLENLKPQPEQKPINLGELIGSMAGKGGGMAKAGMQGGQAQQLQPTNMMGMMQGLMQSQRPQRQNVPLMNLMNM